jgi:hypothetical protein
LGLAIVKKLCQLMQGGLYVDSELGRGSTFTVVLPFVYGPAASASLLSLASAEPAARPLVKESTSSPWILVRALFLVAAPRVSTV